MKQTALDFNLSLKKTHKREFLEQMNQMVPSVESDGLIAPYYPHGCTGRPPFSLESTLPFHFMQQWITLSDPDMEEAFFDTPLYREFAQLDEFGRLPDETTILRFRHRLEKHEFAEMILLTVNELLAQRGLLLKDGTEVGATLITGSTSTKNKGIVRDPDIHSSKKGNQWYFGMGANIGVDAEPRPVHIVLGTSGHVSVISQKKRPFCLGMRRMPLEIRCNKEIEKRPYAQADITCHVAIPPGRRRALNKK